MSRIDASDSEFSARGCLFSAAWTLLSLPFWIGAFVLAVVGTTMESRLFAAALICLLPIPLNFLHWKRGRRRVLTVLLLLVGMGALIACALRAPGFKDNPEISARLIYQNGTKHSRYSPANLVPELDQQILGSYLFALIDPAFGWGQAAELRDQFRKIYRDAAEDPELAALPSVLGFSYQDTLIGRRQIGNLFVYLPDGDEPKPVILFLHGSLGNFKGYWQLWKTFAEENNIAIVAPTFGAGNWYNKGGLDAIANARDYCEGHPRIDAGRIVLAGLSNGGTGVTRAAAATPKAWRGLIFLSPVLESNIIESEEFANGWGGRSALIITGEKDQRTSAKHIRNVEESMDDIGMRIQSHYLPNEDHFLVFSDWPRVRTLMATWLRSEKLLSAADP